MTGGVASNPAWSAHAEGVVRSARLLATLLLLITGPLRAAEDVYPRYKPSSRSPQPLDIRTNAYGASRSAPDALKIGERAPDFTLPRADGGIVSLAEARRAGPVVIVFYRGHW
jgi:hypothetical protein